MQRRLINVNSGALFVDASWCAPGDSTANYWLAQLKGLVSRDTGNLCQPVGRLVDL